MLVCNGRGGNLSHKEIVYEEKCCPLCEVLEELKEIEKDLERIEKNFLTKVEQLEEKINILEKDNEQLRRGCDPAIERKSW